MKSLAPLKAGLAAATVAASIAGASAAQAGTLRVQDDAHQLSAEGVRQVQRAVAEAPFDGRLLVTTEYPEAADLSRRVGDLVTSPDLVAVGLDPLHRHVQVHFGTGSSIPRSQWASIERAGNDAFKRGDYAVGAAAIFTAASSAVAGTVEDQPARQGPVPSGSGIPIVPIVLLGVAGLVVGSFLFRRRTPPEGTYVSGYGPPNYGPNYDDPRYSNPGYGAGYGPRPGMGPIGGGLVGGALGGLAGYELGKAAGEREEREREGRDWSSGSSEGDDGGGNYDEGGGGSSWDGGGGGSDGGGGGGSDF